MTKTTKKWAGALIALIALAWTAQDAAAANPATLNINVAVTANLSVAVNGVQSSTYTGVTWNTSSQQQLTGSTATVLNDSGAQTEKWALSTNGQSIPVSGTEFWTLNTSSSAVGADQFSLQAVFGSSATAGGSCPNGASTDWDEDFADPLTTSPVTYTSTQFANTNLNTGGNGSLFLYNPDVIAGGANGRMFAGRQRALCWRIRTPTTTSTANTQNIQVIITAQNP